MKSNSAREIENKLKEIFKPSHIEVEDSTLVSKKFKVLIMKQINLILILTIIWKLFTL